MRRMHTIPAIRILVVSVPTVGLYLPDLANHNVNIVVTNHLHHRASSVHSHYAISPTKIDFLHWNTSLWNLSVSSMFKQYNWTTTKKIPPPKKRYRVFMIDYLT